MKTTQQRITVLHAFATGLLLLASSHNAFAAGTASGVDITNQATVAYEVNSVSQTPIDSNTTTFKVDAKVDLTVTPDADVNVTPGSTANALKYTVTNTGNETYDFNLAFAAGTEAFATTGLTIHIDDGDGLWNSANDLAGTALNNILADASAVVWLVGDIPATATDNQTSTYHLMATALLEDGSAIPAQAADGVTTKQYVYADSDGPHADDNARDTKHSASLNFVVQSASLTISKSSAVIWDPINLAASPLHIPGAIVEYTITVANGAGGEIASAIVITDVLDSNLTIPTDDARKYEAGKSIKLTTPNLYGGVATNLTDASGDDEATVSGQTVTVTGIALSGGDTATVNILAEIK